MKKTKPVVIFQHLLTPAEKKELGWDVAGFAKRMQERFIRVCALRKTPETMPAVNAPVHIRG